jgi:hypothetical protein
MAGAVDPVLLHCNAACTPFETEIPLHSFFTQSIPRLHYKGQPANSVSGKQSPCIERLTSNHTDALCRQIAEFFNSKARGGCSK